MVMNSSGSGSRPCRCRRRGTASAPRRDRAGRRGTPRGSACRRRSCRAWRTSRRGPASAWRRAGFASACLPAPDLRLGFGLLGEDGAELGDDLRLARRRGSSSRRGRPRSRRVRSTAVSAGCADLLPLDQPIARGADGAAHQLAARIDVEHGLLGRGGRILQHGGEARAVEARAARAGRPVRRASDRCRPSRPARRSSRRPWRRPGATTISGMRAACS